MSKRVKVISAEEFLAQVEYAQIIDVLTAQAERHTEVLDKEVDRLLRVILKNDNALNR